LCPPVLSFGCRRGAPVAIVFAAQVLFLSPPPGLCLLGFFLANICPVAILSCRLVSLSAQPVRFSRRRVSFDLTNCLWFRVVRFVLIPFLLRGSHRCCCLRSLRFSQGVFGHLIPAVMPRWFLLLARSGPAQIRPQVPPALGVLTSSQFRFWFAAVSFSL
jgi:hypothetical protein